MEWASVAVFAACAYLVGSVNTSVVLGRIAGKGDVRRVGSGNPGATNTLRLLGWGWAIVVLLIDSGRGAVCYLLADRLLAGDWQPFIGCFGVLLGNLFPLFHRFRGGKGVATTLGLYVAIHPGAALISMSIWLTVALVARYASLGSVCLVASYPIGLALLGAGWAAVGFGCALIPVVLLTHRENIGRLWRGEERKLDLKR